MSTDRGMDKEYMDIYTMEYYSDIKRTEQPICSNMYGPRDYHTK